jgi:hypothetical protein
MFDSIYIKKCLNNGKHHNGGVRFQNTRVAYGSHVSVVIF